MSGDQLPEFTEMALAISTAHITEADNRVLAADDGSLQVPYYRLGDTGYLIHVAQDSEGLLEHAYQAVAEGMSGAFIALLLFAQTRGYQWILLDRDAAQHSLLKAFDW